MAALAVLVFWSGLLAAVQRYPSEYDWRYITVSILLSPDRDPQVINWASGWSRAGAMPRCAGPEAWPGSGSKRTWVQPDPVGLAALQLGLSSMAWSAAPSAWLPRVRRTRAPRGPGIRRTVIPTDPSRVPRCADTRAAQAVSRIARGVYASVSAGIAIAPILLARRHAGRVFTNVRSPLGRISVTTASRRISAWRSGSGSPAWCSRHDDDHRLGSRPSWTIDCPRSRLCACSGD